MVFIHQGVLSLCPDHSVGLLSRVIMFAALRTELFPQDLYPLRHTLLTSIVALRGAEHVVKLPPSLLTPG